MQTRLWQRCGTLALTVALALFAGCSDNPASSGNICDHVDVDGLVVTHGGNMLAAQWQGTVTGEIHLDPGTTLDEVLVTFLKPDSTAVVFQPGCDVNFEMRTVLAASGIVEITPGSQKWTFDVRALADGETTVRLQIYHTSHSDFTSLEFPVHVGAEEVPPEGIVFETPTGTVASQWQGVVTGSFDVAAGSSSAIVTTTFLDPDSIVVAPEPGASLVFEVANPAIASFALVSGQSFQFRVTGLAAGSTTVIVRVQHMGHFDFTSQPIPVNVSGPLAPQALWVTDGCNPIATWNYDTANGANTATGPIWVEPGVTRSALHVGFLSDQRDSIEVRDEIDFGSGYSLAWTIANPAIVQAGATSGDPFGVDLTGTAAGSTTISFRLLDGATPVYTSGAIPVLVAAAPINPVPDLAVRKNGIWTVIVQGGNVVVSACTRTANPGALAAQVGELTDLYSIRLVDGACATTALPGSMTLLFDFADPCIARVLNHPVHWGENTIFHIQGLSVGTTTLRVTTLANGVLEWRTPPLPVDITATMATRGG